MRTEHSTRQVMKIFATLHEYTSIKM